MNNKFRKRILSVFSVFILIFLFTVPSLAASLAIPYIIITIWAKGGEKDVKSKVTKPVKEKGSDKKEDSVMLKKWKIFIIVILTIGIMVTVVTRSRDVGVIEDGDNPIDTTENSILSSREMKDILDSMEAPLIEVPSFNKDTERLYAAAKKMNGSLVMTIFVSEYIKTSELIRAIFFIKSIEDNHAVMKYIKELGVVNACRVLYPKWTKIDDFLEEKIDELLQKTGSKKEVEYKLDDNQMRIILDVKKNEMEIYISKEGFTREEAEHGIDDSEFDRNEQAILRAQYYVDNAIFPLSREDVISRLESEEFTREEAEYGTSNCKSEWNEQAALIAEKYLDYSTFSRKEIISKLEMEGFTHEEAEYGADKGVELKEQAVLKSESERKNQAKLKAEEFLDQIHFSREETISYLETEGFTREEAEYGVDNCGVDWNEQAALSAQYYIDNAIFPLSREEVISKLESGGFTREEAVYGVDKSGFDRGEQAISRIQYYLDIRNFSRKEVLSKLESEGFTQENAIYGADNCGADWNEQAKLRAQDYLGTSYFSRKGILSKLESKGFTIEEAIYGVDKSGADWKEQAVLGAHSYLDHSPSLISREKIISTLENKGFTREEAAYGVNQHDFDWKKQAVAIAKYYSDSYVSREEILSELESEGFTSEEAEYAVKVVFD